MNKELIEVLKRIVLESTNKYIDKWAIYRELEEIEKKEESKKTVPKHLSMKPLKLSELFPNLGKDKPLEATEFFKRNGYPQLIEDLSLDDPEAIANYILQDFQPKKEYQPEKLKAFLKGEYDEK